MFTISLFTEEVLESLIKTHSFTFLVTGNLGSEFSLYSVPISWETILQDVVRIKKGSQ